MDSDIPIPESDGKYWVGVIGPVDFPANSTLMDIAPRRAAVAAVQKTIREEFEISEDLEMDIKCWSEWGIEKNKIDNILVALFADDEHIDGCSQLKKLQKENERLERILGTIMMKVEEIEIFNMDIREFHKVGGYVEETRDGNVYRYKWISSSEQL